MKAKRFPATAGRGLSRAERAANGWWTLERVLADHDVRCLAADPLNRQVVYAGTEGRGVWCSHDRGRS